MAHKHEIEHLLHNLFNQLAPETVGNDYLIVGTVEKYAWREGLKQPKQVKEVLPHAHDFKEYFQELRMTQPGWYRDDEEPRVMDPPESSEWLKRE